MNKPVVIRKPGMILVLFLGCLLTPGMLQSQPGHSLSEDSSTVNKARLTGVLATQGILYVGSLTSLYFAWYKEYPQSTFHLFNDTDAWMQMDKCGHALTANYISRLGYETYRWAGLNDKQSAWIGGLLGFAFLLNVEILDGFSSGWGFSLGDLAANSLGCVIFTGQQLAWHEQRFSLKYSFHQTSYPQYHPELLGKSLVQQMLKDYNGQTYWISANISSFMAKGKKFPRWLNFAIGYGAEGMTSGHTIAADRHGASNPDFHPYRKFYFSADIDLTRIPTKSGFLRSILTVLSFIKIPAPAIEYNSLGQIKFYPIYF